MLRSDQTLFVLHSLRLKGVAAVGDVAALWGLSPATVVGELRSAADVGLASFTDAGLVGWHLTTAGRHECDRLLRDELDRLGARSAVDALYRDFLPLNRRLLAACAAWQVSDADNGVLNDHDDPSYDNAVIEDLVQIHAEIEPLMAHATATLERFSIHRTRLQAAIVKVRADDFDWFTKPLIDSYHTVWFELHADLLATLGLDRATERS